MRACHGDLHLGNIALVDGHVMLFDCIEFNDSFRFIDVMSEIAFLLMDLEDKGQFALATHFLNHYVAETGDFEGIELLRCYKVFRALVRAKVHLMTSASAHSQQLFSHGIEEFHKYMLLAASYINLSKPVLYIMCGFSGSGKSYAGSRISRQIGAVHIRSDVERKRLYGMTALERSNTKFIYDSDSTKRTYAYLSQVAVNLLTWGYTVLLDATFLKLENRMIVYQAIRDSTPLLNRWNSEIEIHVLHLTASEQILAKRIEERNRSMTQDASEATPAVLRHQLSNFDSLTSESDQANAIIHEIDIEHSSSSDAAVLLKLVEIGHFTAAEDSTTSE